MSTYFILANWTEQGIKDVKASPKRLRAAKRLAKDCGVKFRSFHMTLGQYDIILSVEAPDDEAVARFALGPRFRRQRPDDDPQGFHRARVPEDHRVSIIGLPQC